MGNGGKKGLKLMDINIENFKISNVVAYHIVFDLTEEYSVGDKITTPITKKRNIKYNAELESVRPKELPLRSQALFVCKKGDINNWIIEFGLLPNGVKSFKVLTLELSGNLFWLDKDKFTKYHFERNARPNEVVDSTKYACEYWKSLLTNNQLQDRNVNGQELYEGLFYGEAKIIDINEQKLKRQEL